MRLSVVDAQRCVGCQLCMFACARIHKEGGFAASCIGVKSAGGMRNGFTVVVCRACQDPPCARVCPANALEPRGEGKGGVVFHEEKCIGCGHCKQACPIGAVFWDKGTNKPMICRYCGYCAKYCPHGVLAFEDRGKGADHAAE